MQMLLRGFYLRYAVVHSVRPRTSGIHKTSRTQQSISFYYIFNRSGKILALNCFICLLTVTKQYFIAFSGKRHTCAAYYISSSNVIWGKGLIICLSLKPSYQCICNSGSKQSGRCINNNFWVCQHKLCAALCRYTTKAYSVDVVKCSPICRRRVAGRCCRYNYARHVCLIGHKLNDVKHLPSANTYNNIAPALDNIVSKSMNIFHAALTKERFSWVLALLPVLDGLELGLYHLKNAGVNYKMKFIVQLTWSLNVSLDAAKRPAGACQKKRLVTKFLFHCYSPLICYTFWTTAFMHIYFRF